MLRKQLLNSVSTQGMATMLLSTYLKKQNEGFVLELKGPDGKPWYKADGLSPVTITLAGNESQHWRAAEKEIASERDKLDDKNLPWSERRMIAPRMYARATLGWDGIDDPWSDKLGEALEFNRVNAAKLFADFDFIRIQVDEAIGKRANFMPAS